MCPDFNANEVILFGTLSSRISDIAVSASPIEDQSQISSFLAFPLYLTSNYHIRKESSLMASNGKYPQIYTFIDRVGQMKT
jgi:hypothetical protein